MAENRWIKIFDTTLRDGEQSPGCSMNLGEKMHVAQALVNLGVDVIEAGFPIASPGDFESVREIASNFSGPIICGLARCNDADIDRAWEALQHANPAHSRLFGDQRDPSGIQAENDARRDHCHRSPRRDARPQLLPRRRVLTRRRRAH